MILTENQIIIPKLPVSQLNVGVNGTVPGVGSIYLANASAQTIIGISVDTVPATLIQGYLLGESPGTAPQWIVVPRISASAGPFFGADSLLMVTFVGGQTWSQNIKLTSYAPSFSLWVWLFYNGVIVSDPVGNLVQVSWG